MQSTIPWSEISEPAQDGGFVEDAEPVQDSGFVESAEPVQDGLFIPLRGFGFGYFGQFIFGHALPNEGWD